MAISFNTNSQLSKDREVAMFQRAALFFSPQIWKIRLPVGGRVGMGERKGLANTVFTEEGSTGKDFLTR